MPGTDDLSFYTTFYNDRHEVQEPTVTLEASLESHNDGPSSKPTPAPDVPQTFTDLFNSPLP